MNTDIQSSATTLNLNNDDINRQLADLILEDCRRAKEPSSYITNTLKNDSIETLIQDGLRHTVELLDRLIKQNGNYQSSRIDVGTFLSWLAEDHPEWFANLAESGSAELFAPRVKSFLYLAQRREQLCGYLAQTESKLDWHDTTSMDKRRIVHEAIQHILPRRGDKTGEESINDATFLLADSFSSKTTGVCAVRRAPQVQRYMVAEISPALQAVRQLANTAKPDTCFIVARGDAPQSLQEYIHEQVAIVVPLAATCDAPWIFYSQDGRPTYREVIFDDGDGPISMPLLVGFERGRIFFDYEALRERLFDRLRVELPIMYVSSQATVLATHPFQPFTFSDDFYAEVTNFQMGWESDVNHGMTFETRVDRLRRERVPRHVYINRFVEDLTHPASSRPTKLPPRHLPLPAPNELPRDER